ncbi:MAG TPA: sulfite exporter TauE/SafE family protein [Vulgatibacter sp.]
MSASAIPLLLFATGAGAGALGALLGVGGGIVLVPILSLAFGVPLQHAVAVSLACVIASSSGAAAAYVRDHRCDVRLGMKLELFTVAGAIAGAFVAPHLPASAVQILFGLLVIPVARSLLKPTPTEDVERVEGRTVEVRNLPLGYAASFGAGTMSAVLGIGGGPIKVPLMTLLMGVPFKVATATSNLMIGVTAAASVFVYLSRGLLDFGVAVPTVLGVIAGATIGARLMPKVPTRALKKVFALMLGVVGIEMLAKGFGVNLWSFL